MFPPSGTFFPSPQITADDGAGDPPLFPTKISAPNGVKLPPSVPTAKQNLASLFSFSLLVLAFFSPGSSPGNIDGRSIFFLFLFLC